MKNTNHHQKKDFIGKPSFFGNFLLMD